jgi:hypothetical protein
MRSFPAVWVFDILIVKLSVSHYQHHDNISLDQLGGCVYVKSSIFGGFQPVDPLASATATTISRFWAWACPGCHNRYYQSFSFE